MSTWKKHFDHAFGVAYLEHAAGDPPPTLDRLDLAESDFVTMWNRGGFGELRLFHDVAILEAIGKVRASPEEYPKHVRQAAALALRLRRALRVHLKVIK